MVIENCGRVEEVFLVRHKAGNLLQISPSPQSGDEEQTVRAEIKRDCSRIVEAERTSGCEESTRGVAADAEFDALPSARATNRHGVGRGRIDQHIPLFWPFQVWDNELVTALKRLMTRL